MRLKDNCGPSTDGISIKAIILSNFVIFRAFTFKKFGKEIIVFLLFIQRKNNHVLLSRFKYKLPDGIMEDKEHMLEHFEGKAEVNGMLFAFTINKQYLENLDNFYIKELYKS